MTHKIRQTPQSSYQALIKNKVLLADEGQSAIIHALDELYREVSQKPKKRSVWQKLTASSHDKKIRGLYIYGGVGRGKSRLMDLFYDCLDDGQATRVHFHDFMVAAHDAMNEARQSGADDPIKTGALALLKSQSDGQKAATHILCFDEMEVRDIADAMIVKRLFDVLFEKQIIVIATSNRHPNDLYENGLHRDRFVPFIESLKTHCQIMRIADGNDWRSRLLGTAPRWYVPADGRANKEMAKQFAIVTSGSDPESVIIKVAGRDIHFDRVAHNIAFTDFASLCNASLAARDYVAIADRLTGLFITDIPALGNAEQNEARRFMWLIDALYDRGRFIVASAEQPMTDLYTGDVWAFEFDRTLSRLSEMTRQSHEGKNSQ